MLAQAADEDVRLRLFPTCKLVKGAAYSAVYDMDRRRLLRFSTAYYPLFEQAAGQAGLAMSEVESLDPLPRARALEAIDEMRRNEVLYPIDRRVADAFQPLPEHWASPSEIINCIVDVDAFEHDWEPIIEALSAMRCRGLQLRAFSSVMTFERTIALLELLNGSCISNVQILVRWEPAWAEVDWVALMERFRGLLLARIYAAPADEEINGETHPRLMDKRVIFETREVNGPGCCGDIAPATLCAPSSALLGELKLFNGCLNRKVSIRADGEICNCPSMRAGFGKDLARIREIVRTDAFQRTWTLRKDDISICRDCEFRYVCTDCRAYLESDVSLAKPSRCRYDPYTGTWGGDVNRLSGVDTPGRI